MVYVLDIEGKPLMPTNNAKARILLKQKKAIVKTINPFTIQLNYKTTDYTQPITLGIDSGYLNIGFSAVTDKKELISGEVQLLQGMSQRIEEKAMYRRTRRNRLRYRKPRWNNRKKSKKEGWIAPSIQHKLDSHIRFIEKLHNILPISKIVVEVANFDIQKINNPDISGVEYQQGEQMGFWNLREYILHRDNHTCQNPDCKNKDKNPILQVHHILYQSEGGTDKPSNLITLCSKCHTSANHKKGKFLYDWMMKGKKVRGFKDAAYMNMIRWRLVNILKDKYDNVEFTYGYITKNHRIHVAKLEKTHYNDAFCIANGKEQIRSETYNVKQMRRNNRSLEKFYDAKYIDIRTGEKVSGGDLNSGRRTRNKNLNTENLRIYRGEKVFKGRRSIRKQRYSYQKGDLIKYNNKTYTCGGTSDYGKYVLLPEIDKKKYRIELISPYKFCKGLVFTKVKNKM